MRLTINMLVLSVLFVLLPAALLAAEPVSLAVAKVDGHDVIKLQNYRVSLTVDPTHGGAITSYSDKLAPAELVLQKSFNGLCMDHFQEQSWPGEMLEVPYDYKIVVQTPEEAQVTVSRKVSGVWGGKLANKKLSDLLLEKTYTLRADSPAITCAVKLTAPVDEAKVFSYWVQNVYFAGGDFDQAVDRTFRPSARGVRSSAQQKNGMYGAEEWLRDFSDGWMALVDTQKKSGLAAITDYNDLRINYACGGNLTNELMFNTNYLPKGQSRTYVTQLTPIIGLDKILHVGGKMLVGYAISTDNKGAGSVKFAVERSAEVVRDLTFAVSVAGATDGKEVKVGTATFGPLVDAPQEQSLVLANIPSDPVVLRVTASGHTADGKEFTEKFEDFFSGAYKWGDNIQTDMRSPVYAAERPPQKLTIAKPAQMLAKRTYAGSHLFFQGLLDEEYNIAGAVHLAGYDQKTDVIYYNYSGSWYGELSDFPYDYDKLLSYDCVILGGVSKSGLKPLGLEMMQDYLQAGGGLVVLGSHGAYGRSQLKGTKLADAFPVDFSSEISDLKMTGGKRVSMGPDTADFLKYSTLSDKATCYFLHPATAKPGAKVLMQVDGQPFMVAGEYGPNKARIVCILGAPMGSPAAGQTPFWQEDDWCLMLRNAIWWVSHRDEHFAE